MYTTFRNNKIRKLCEKHDHAIKKLGPEQAEKLFLRVSQVQAATTLAELQQVPGARCHLLRGDRNGQYAVDLVQPSRLILQPIHDLEVFDAKQVTEVEIVGIVKDYH